MCAGSGCHPAHCPPPARLVVDATGCGRPVVDLLRQARLDPIAVTIHGGDQVTHEGHSYRVPKRDLVGAVQVLLQTSRLKIADALPLASVLVQELLNFRVTIDSATAHDSYSAWREADQGPVNVLNGEREAFIDVVLLDQHRSQAP